MSTTGTEAHATPAAASLPSLLTEALLEVCAFLDAKSLGRMEVCGRIGGLSRAWNMKADGVARGVLGPMPPKRLVATHARLRSLYPTSPRTGHNLFVYSETVSFDEFAFSVAISHSGCDTSDFHVSAFEHMRLIQDRSEMGDFDNCAQFAMLPPADASGQLAETSRLLRECADSGDGMTKYTSSHHLSVLLCCTRKADGASMKVVEWISVADDSQGFADPGNGSLYFEFGELFSSEDRRGHEETSTLDYVVSLQIHYDASTGRVLAFCPGVSTDDGGGYMGHDIFLALLRSRIQAAG